MMDPDTTVELTSRTWVKTREAVAHFRKLLLCSKCSQILIEPVCLGICEHLLCRRCAGPHAGDGCTVCHSPAWVKDIQINRQISNIADLFRSLESLLQSSEVPVAGDNPPPVFSKSTAVTQKKNFTIWFSPKSRRVRCSVERPTRANISTRKAPGPPPKVEASSPLAVYNFNSSSQDSGSSSPLRVDAVKGKKKKRKRVGATFKQASGRAELWTKLQNKQKMKKMRLEAVNQQWGFSSDAAMEDKMGEEDDEGKRSGDVDLRTSKKVSFQYPSSQPEVEPQDPVLQKGTQILSPRRSILKEGTVEEAGQRNEEQRPVVASGVEEPKGSPQSTPRRPRPSPGRRRRLTPGQAAALPTPPPSPGSSGPPMVPGRSAEEQQSRAESLRAVVEGSPDTPTTGGGAVVEPRRHRSPAHLKRNRKGETPLHLAAIKGDTTLTEQLLTQGADPNLKDHAGWTPLHEACNLGHLGVVEVLVQQGALLNTPGYENDSPLHDAVRNGHVGVVRRLLEHGASPNVLNIFGLQPVNYAGTPEMREILSRALATPSPVTTPLRSPASMSKPADVMQKDVQVTVMGTKLTRAQQNQLSEATQALGGRRAQTFSRAVSHVVVPEAGVPSTLTALQAILGGCWVLRFSWLAGCLQHGSWLDEGAFEAGEGPQRGRTNRLSLLPQLFDGCFFYLLGSFRTPPKDELLQLIKAGGGQLLARRPKPDSDVTQSVSVVAYHASPGSDQALCTQYVLYDPQGSYKPKRVRLGKVWSAPSSWLLDCVLAFRILPVPEL